MSKISAISHKPRSSHRVCILVLGMHRSGTSAFTRVLNLLGCDLPATPMPANESNESGHWESEAIRQLNDRILASAGTRWDDWLEVNPGWLMSPKAAEFREEALRLVRQEFGSSRLFVLKDPRICRLVPFWLAVLKEAGARPLIVSPVRNPLEVAASLGSRDGFEAGLGHLLWLRHVLDAEFASRGIPRFFTSYDRLMGGWARTASDAQTALEIAWPRMSDMAAREIEGFLSERHRHYQQPLEAVLENPTLSNWLRSTFEILSNWIAAGEDPRDFSLLDGIRMAVNTAAPAFSRLLSVEQEKAARLEEELGIERQRVGEAQQQVTWLTGELEGKAGATKATEQVLAETRSKLATAEKLTTAEKEKAARLEEELSSERQRIGMAEQQILRLSSELESRTRMAEEAQRSLVEVRHQLAQTESALAQRRHEAEETAGELAAAREDLRQAGAARAEAEQGASRLKDHIVLLMADVQERQAALRAEREARAIESAETDKAVAAVAKQVRQVLAVLDASRSEMASRMLEAEQARAKQVAELETQLQQQTEEIEALMHRVKENQGEARHQRAQAEQIRKLVAGEFGRAVTGLLNSQMSPFRWRPFRLRRQISHLKRSGLFDAQWYLRQNNDVARAGIDPLRHYIQFGAKEGRAPNAALAHAEAEVPIKTVAEMDTARESTTEEPAVADALKVNA